jgi:16S rRNA (guanine527-N7)-methyltransferase
MNFKEEVLKFNISLDDSAENKLNTYFSFLVEYNNHTNLTAITEHDDVFIKHFLDSMLLNCAYDLSNKTLCDVGAGAGFPSVPNAIINKDVKVDIVDSLNKRIIFLNELIKRLGINNVNAYHARAEEWALTKRESYDVVSARAVARLQILAELCLPLVKIGGAFVAMKSLESKDELSEAKKAIEVLGGKVKEIKHFELPYNMGSRDIIIIEKVKETPKKYPRAFAKIKQNPIN